MQCAEKILGTGNTKANFSSFTLDMWRKVIKKELRNSGLPSARQRLSIDMVAQARQQQLLFEGHQLWKQVRKLVNGQR